MAKAAELTADIMSSAVPVPKAAQAPTAPVEAKRIKAAPKAKVVPLQVRLPASDVKAAKLAAIEGGFPTVSEFMFTYFLAYMKGRK